MNFFRDKERRQVKNLVFSVRTSLQRADGECCCHGLHICLWQVEQHIPSIATPEPETQVTFPGETDSTGGIKRMSLEMGRLSWVIQVDQTE